MHLGELVSRNDAYRGLNNHLDLLLSIEEVAAIVIVVVMVNAMTMIWLWQCRR